MSKIESPFLPGFYDGEVYTSTVEFLHTALDEFNVQDLKKEHINWLIEHKFFKVNDDGMVQIFFPAGTQFTKLTAGVLDRGDCWHRFALTQNPEIKLLLGATFASLYEIFGVKEPEKSDDEEDEKDVKYEYAPSEYDGWFS